MTTWQQSQKKSKKFQKPIDKKHKIGYYKEWKIR